MTRHPSAPPGPPPSAPRKHGNGPAGPLPHRSVRWSLLVVAALSAGCSGGDGAGTPARDASNGPSALDSSQTAPLHEGGVLPEGGSSMDGAMAVLPGDGASPSNEASADDSGPFATDATPPDPGTTSDAAARDGAGPGTDASVGPPSDGGAVYSPCPVKTSPCVIMPVGDSITEGFRSTDHGGYRSELFHLALADKKNITFVGSATPYGPSTVDGVPFPKNSDGHGGYRIDQIQALIVASMTANKPDIVTLMIGTNDINQQTNLAMAPARLATLMDTILTQDPHLALFVAQIVPTTDDTINTRVQAFNAAMPALVKARADAGKHIALVDMYTPFVTATSYKTVLMRGGTTDYLHPTEAGYQLLGQVWYQAVKPLLP
ncbi:MAG: GDSL-type esterase/lipase family protein [Myxococcota bacterium]|nr:GDSL-type esterase/lipase family protein [Myxococcota bacterium]